jgi:DAACS family dicarboxylate/amino acid:cation (Na+ or H+) symporter
MPWPAANYRQEIVEITSHVARGACVLPLTGRIFAPTTTSDLSSKIGRMALHNRILLGLVFGAAAGIAVNAVFGGEDYRVDWIIVQITEPVGELFLRLLLMTVVPLVFSSLVVGVAGIGDLRRLGRIGLKCFAYTVVISAISVGIGLALTNIIRPGERLNPATAEALMSRYGTEAGRQVESANGAQPRASAMMQAVQMIVPSNPLSSVASSTPSMLHLMFFAVVLAIAITQLPASTTGPLVQVFDAIFAVSAKIIDLIMRIAPYAVACLLFTNTARFGFELLLALGWFVVTVLLGLALHMFGVYSLSLSFLSRISPPEFFRRVKTVMVTAFSTSSSNATLPTALKVSEENLGVPREISTFVLTVGATANQNGTALYEGVTVLFLAQLAGVDLTLGQQVLVAYMAILGGVGTAGVPSGSIPFIIVVLTTVGINPSLIALILGIDRILDMCRTTLNVTGDLTAATYVARSEGHALLKPQPVLAVVREHSI